MIVQLKLQILLTIVYNHDVPLTHLEGLVISDNIRVSHLFLHDRQFIGQLADTFGFFFVIFAKRCVEKIHLQDIRVKYD